MQTARGASSAKLEGRGPSKSAATARTRWRSTAAYSAAGRVCV
ncbi:hypothetical protein BSIN_3903 [Burkholderia singularis]|uniref:Uncharacterized protein n=1 Tax=Burkholderia singularis TaxID=1503053 RepID=A0A238H6R2_9BURK|nr:hypothetical protein BSIN_3903 [Burkholderia singularis]